MQRVQVQLSPRRQKYEIQIGAGLLSKLGQQSRVVLPKLARRAVVVSNQTVFELYGRKALESLRESGFETHHWLMKDGERYKSFRSLEQLLKFTSECRLERSDAIFALGGGVVGDLAGFAAAIYQRGISFIQVPTTLLAQIDASVGGKTAVNTPFGKNFVGAFHQPGLVMIDVDTLQTLPERELTAGWCEAVKQGAIANRELFDQTKQLLAQTFRPSRLASTIAAHCRFKAKIVAGDEREAIGRADHRSRRILNFGHTTAHALEKLTAYRRFRHGEAVGYGVVVAGEISKNLGMLAAGELESLREAIRLCGSLPRADDLAVEQIIDSTMNDKKSVGGSTRWILLERIGRPRIVDSKEIDHRTLRTALRAGLRSLI